MGLALAEASVVSEDAGSKRWVFLFLVLSSLAEASNLTRRGSTVGFACATS